MAYTYLGQLSLPLISSSYWNGTSWSTPVISSGNSPASLGTRQGIDPVETGSWNRRDVRLNGVKIIRETAAAESVNIDFKPHPSWGMRLSGPINAAFWMDPGVYLPSALTFSTSSANYALQKTLAKLSKAQFEAGTNLGELRETLDMLRNPLKGIRDFLRRGARQPGESIASYSRRIGDNSSSTWLEYRYGIRPLISTIEDLLKLYREGLGVDVVVGKTYRRKSVTSFATGSTTNRSNTFGSLLGTQVISAKASESYHGGIYFSYDNLPTTAQLLGVDMLSLPDIAWELTRLSFVWDWFFGVGNWIGGLKSLVNRTIKGCYVSHKVVKTVSCSIVPNSLYVSGQPTWKPPDNYSQAAYTSKVELLERRVMSLTGIVLPSYNPKDLGIAKQLDSLTLLWQRLPRR